MNIRVLDKSRKKLIATQQKPEDYLIPTGEQVLETVDLKRGEGLYKARKCIHLDGVYLNYYTRSQVKEREMWVQSDAPYLQMHLEMTSGSSYYRHKNGQLSVPIAKGEFAVFSVPELNGSLRDPICKDAITVEIEISLQWIKEHINTSNSFAADFLKDAIAGRPSLLGGKPYAISPQIYRTVQDLFDCPYVGHVKRLYLEAKLMELFAHQLYQVEAGASGRSGLRLSKIDVGQLHAIREMITVDLSRHFSIEELSYLSHMNRTKLQAGFKALFGLTLYDFLIEKRMELAYQLLTESYAYHWNIAEIAQKVGYRHSNHFSAAFKKRFGVSPGWFLKG